MTAVTMTATRLLRVLLTLSAVLWATTARPIKPRDANDEGSGWGYGDVAAWGGTCATGVRQSPVDLTDAEEAPLGHLFIDYTKSFRHWLMVNNDHSIKIAPNEDGMPDSDFTLMGASLPSKYRMAQLHMHWGKDDGSGSEHTLDGKSYPMEVHLVHVKDKFPTVADALADNDSSALAVIGVFFELGDTPNTFLEKVFDASPMDNVTAGPTEMKVLADLPVEKLLPTSGGLYRYSGSLTTPTCNEIVEWSVFAQPMSMTAEQLDKLRSIQDSSGQSISGNYRPVQPLNGRTLLFDPITTWQTPYMTSRNPFLNYILLPGSLQRVL